MLYNFKRTTREESFNPEDRQADLFLDLHHPTEVGCVMPRDTNAVPNQGEIYPQDR